MRADRLHKPLRTLRKGLKSLPSDPAPEQVHKLRTHARQMETVAAALTPSSRHKAKRLLKTIKPVRKAAGDVRDMDVMTENALKLAQPPGHDSLARLVTHLATTRMQTAAHLADEVDRRRKAARRSLKRFETRMDSALKLESAEQSVKLEGSIRAAADKIRGELSRWPGLAAANIHRFRLKIKQLRSLLQLERYSDSRLIRALGNTKDKIGDWHDWQQLEKIAKEILHAHQDRALLTEIHRVVGLKLGKALIASNALRNKYLRPILVFKKAS